MIHQKICFRKWEKNLKNLKTSSFHRLNPIEQEGELQPQGATLRREEENIEVGSAEISKI